MMSRLREMLLLPKGSEFKNDIYSEVELNKWKGINYCFELIFINTIYKIYNIYFIIFFNLL